jgi:hypothetical protein
VALALVRIDVDLQVCHCGRSFSGAKLFTPDARITGSGGGFLSSAPPSYTILHSRLRCSSSEKNRHMSRLLSRKPQNTYHHGDLREAL